MKIPCVSYNIGFFFFLSQEKIKTTMNNNLKKTVVCSLGHLETSQESNEKALPQLEDNFFCFKMTIIVSS